jgi:hypothetical protein
LYISDHQEGRKRLFVDWTFAKLAAPDGFAGALCYRGLGVKDIRVVEIPSELYF